MRRGALPAADPGWMYEIERELFGPAVKLNPNWSFRLLQNSTSLPPGSPVIEKLEKKLNDYDWAST